MKQPGQPPNWGQQQQQRMRQQQQQQQQRMRQQQQQQQQRMQQQLQQQQRRAAGYAWQQQKQREQEAQRAQAQRLSQPSAVPGSAVPGWQEGGQIAPLPAASPRRRSCLGTVAIVIGILLAAGLCLFIAAVILSS
jgi:hypothetical protein